MAPIMAMFSLLACIGVTLLLSFLKGRIFNYAITSIFSITICGYIQGNFLNTSVGALTGEAIAWNKLDSVMIINLFIWFIFFMIPYFILFLDEKMWRGILKFTSAMLITMQFVAFISLSLNGAIAIEKERYSLGQVGMFDYSSNENTLVFLLDALDYKYIDMVLEDDPHFFDCLEGFTSYTNAISEHTQTVPSVNYIFTNSPNAYDIPFRTYVEQSWEQENKNILKELKKAEYDISIYSDMFTIFGDTVPIDLVSNVIKDEGINTKELVKRLVKLSLYRYSPLALKPFFWSYTEDINTVFYADGYKIDESIYAKGIDKFSLSENNQFKFYHFMGSHPPYVLTENGKRSETPTDVVRQTKGSFNILFTAFDKMKHLGIYDDTTI